jgi:anti-sigma factor RsiW
MDHETLRKRLYELYDGELDGAARKELEAHLTLCSECRERIDRWAETSRLIFQTPKPQPSEFFVRTVMSRIQELESQNPAPGWGISLGWLIPAISALGLLFLATQPAPIPVSMDLLLSGSQDIGSAIIVGRAPTTDEALEFVMGG